MSIAAITFDFWRTLFRDTNKEARQQIRVDALVKATGVSEMAAVEAFQRTWVKFDRHHRQEGRTLYPEDAVRMTTETLGVTLSPEAASELAAVFAKAVLKESPEPIEGALDAVRAAAQARPVGILSDAGISPGASLTVLLERHGFLRYLTALIFSDEVRVAKPQSLMFETAARRLGVQPKELLHIGDLEYTDICGAKAVGARTVLFAGDNSAHLHHTEADHVVISWHEFIRRLPNLIGPVVSQKQSAT